MGKIVTKHQIIKNLTQLMCRDLSAVSVCRILLHMVLPDLGCGCTADGIQDHIDAITLAAALHAADHSSGFLCDIFFLEFCLAVQAASAVAFSIFSKIFQDIFPETVMGKTVKSHLSQSLLIPLSYQLLCCRIHLQILLSALDQVLVSDNILAAIEKDTFRRISVASCTAAS